MQFLTQFWKRHVTGQPDRYQAYISLPTRDTQRAFGEVHECIEELEHVFEGRLDVYARVRGMAVATDPVPADQFDRVAFEAALKRLEDCYAETHSLARLEKWRPSEGRLTKSYVVVPVKPLFPRDRTDDVPRVRSAAE